MLRADVSRKRDLAIKRHRAERVEHRMFVKKLLEGLVLVLRRHGYTLLPPPMRCLCTSLSSSPGTGPLHFDSLPTLPREEGILTSSYQTSLAARLTRAPATTLSLRRWQGVNGRRRNHDEAWLSWNWRRMDQQWPLARGSAGRAGRRYGSGEKGKRPRGEWWREW